MNFEIIRSPWKLFFKVLLVLFVGNLFLGVVLFRICNLSELSSAVVLSLVLAPFLWWWIVRPLDSAGMRERLLAANLINKSLNAIITIDHEGRITALNPAAEELFGYSKLEAIGQDFTLIMSLAERERYEKHIRRQLNTDEQKTIGFERELITRHKDGSTLPVHVSISPAHAGDRPAFTAIVQDLTESKRAEDALRASEERFRLAMQHSAIGMALVDPDGRWLDVNDALCQIVGYSREELLAKTFQDITHPDDVIADLDALRQMVERKMEAYHTDKRYVHKSGRIVWISLSVSVVWNADSKARYFISQMQDITDRKRASARLARERLFSETVINSLPGIFYVFNRAGKFLRWNNNFEQITGYSKQEIATLKPLDFFVGSEKDLIAERIKTVSEAGAAEAEAHLVSKSGERKLYYFTGVLIHVNEEPCVLGVGLDVTDRRRAEDQLMQSEAKYRGLIDGMQEGLLVKDRNHRITFINRRGCELLGYQAEELIGQSVTCLFDEENEKTLKAQLTHRANGEYKTYEIAWRRKDGGKIDTIVAPYPRIDDNEQLIEIVAVFTDITDRKAAENELSRLAAAIEQTGDSVVITDPQGSIQYVNPAFERISGYSRMDALGKNPRILNSGKTAPEVYADLWNTITRGNVWSGQLTNRKKDGSVFEERVTISPVRNRHGRIVNYIAVKQDITNQVQLEKQLQQSQRLEGIGQLAGGVAHDFNNLLTAILGYSDLTLAKLEPGSRLANNVTEIKKAGERAASLTRQLLAFSRKQIVAPRVLDLNSVISDINKMLRRLIGEDIELVTKPGVNLGPIKADPTQIEQVLMNLVVNARDAMPLGGRLTIETRNVTLDADYTTNHQSVVTGNYVMLAISDTGIGMSAETQAHIFEPFFTTKGAGKGTGLGLSTIYGIVKQSGGYVWVYSEEGQGTTFKVYLPRVTEPSEPAASGEAKTAIMLGSETLLLVEDDASVRNVTARFLLSAGYKVLKARASKEALEIAKEYRESIHLVLTDVVMPELNGRELAERLQDILPRAPVLFMSGYTDDAMMRAGIIGEGIAFIEKPFTPQKLTRKIREVLGQPAT